MASWSKVTFKFPIITTLMGILSDVAVALDVVATLTEAIADVLKILAFILGAAGSLLSLDFSGIINLILQLLEQLTQQVEAWVIFPDPIRASSNFKVSKLPRFEKWVEILCNSMRAYHENQIPIYLKGMKRKLIPSCAGAPETFGKQFNFNGNYSGMVLLLSATAPDQYCLKAQLFKKLAAIDIPVIGDKYGYVYEPSAMTYAYNNMIIKPYRLPLKGLFTPIRDIFKLSNVMSGVLPATDSAAEALNRLADSLDQKANQLEQVANEIEQLAQDLTALTSAFSIDFIAFENVGGIDALQNLLLSAPNAPKGEYCGGVCVLADTAVLPILRTLLTS